MPKNAATKCEKGRQSPYLADAHKVVFRESMTGHNRVHLMTTTPEQNQFTDRLYDLCSRESITTLGVRLCVQCGRCTSACLAGFQSGETPRQVIRHLQWDEIEEAIDGTFLNSCKQCVACTLKCPQGVDVAGVMRMLMRASLLTLRA